MDQSFDGALASKLAATLGLIEIDSHDCLSWNSLSFGRF